MTILILVSTLDTLQLNFLIESYKFLGGRWVGEWDLCHRGGNWAYKVCAATKRLVLWLQVQNLSLHSIALFKKIIALLIYSSHIIQFTYSKYTMQLFFVHSQSCTIITTIDLWTSSSPPKETLYPWAVIVITGRGKNTFKLEEKRWVGRTVWGKQRRPRLSRGHAVWSQVPCPLWFLVSSQYKYVFTEHLPCARLQARYVTDIHDHSL